MKKLAILALIAVVPAFALAAPPAQQGSSSSQGLRIGVGGSVSADDSSIYVPIELSPAFRLEPFIQWSESETTTGGPGPSFKSKFHTLGAGGFLRFEPLGGVHPYAGGRLGYMESDSFGVDIDGFRLEATAGAEYFVVDRFSVALEAFAFHSDLDGSNNGFATESKSTGTDTRLLVRVYPF